LEPERFGVKITKYMYDRMLSDYPILKNVFSHSKQAVRVIGLPRKINLVNTYKLFAFVL
jgi:nitric oxide dioxygenase